MNGASFEWSMRVRDFDLANRAKEAAFTEQSQPVADGHGDQGTHPRDADGRFARTEKKEGV